MYEVYFENWQGRDEEPLAVFDTDEELEQFLEHEDQVGTLGEDEWYIIYDKQLQRWY